MKHFKLTIQRLKKPDHIYWMKLRIVCDCGNVLIARHSVLSAEYEVTCAKCSHLYQLMLPVG